MEDDSYCFLKPQSVRQQFIPEFQANPRNKSMSCSNFVLKFVVIALFLCVIPLFPSDPPEFISETIFAKSWELIHLLVIGIALSYGLFCRRKIPEQTSAKSHNYQQYNANALRHSSVFDYEDENPSVKFNRNAVENKSYDFSCYRTEPYVVVRQGSGEKVEERSLGLPVRSLRSRVVESDSEDECVSECESECSGESSCSNSSSFTRSEKGQNLGGNVERNASSNGWNSRSMREGFMEGNGGFEIHGGKAENFEGIMGSNGFPNGLKSRSLRAGLVEENGDFELDFGKGETFEGNVGSNVFINGWNSRSMMAGFKGGNGDFELGIGKGENFEGNVGDNVAQNGWKSRSMRTGFMVGNSDVDLHCGKGENFDGNVGSSVSPKGWNSQSMRAGFMAESGNVELASGKGENLEGNVGNSSLASWRSRSMRSDFMINNGAFESDLSKTRSFRSPVQGGASCGMNAGFCSWLPESPNMVEGNSWSRVTNMPFPNFHTQVNDSNLVGSSPTLEDCTTPSNFFMSSTANPPSVTVSTSDFTSGSMMYNYEKCNWGTSPILENANKFVENSALFMPSEKDVAQPTYGSSLKKNEEYFMPQTPEIPPSTPCPSGELGSSVRTSRRTRSKLKLSGKKNEQQLEKDINVEVLAQGDNPNACAIDDVALPINGSFPKKNEDFLPKAPNNEDTSLNSDSLLRNAPNNEFASSAKAPWSANSNHGPLLKKDNGVRSERGNETPEDDVIAPSTKGSFLNQNEQRSTPMKWDEDCFVIPLSENNDIEDPMQVMQDDPTPEPAYLSEVASSSTRMSCDEQGSEQNGVEEDVQLKGTADYSEIEACKPSTPSPPPQVQIRANETDFNILTSVESCSRALSDGFLLDERHDMDQGSPLTPKRGKSLSKTSHSRRFSCTSFFDRDLRKSFKNEAREENRKSEGDQYVGRAGKCGCLSLDVRPTLSKAALKGKSVRTIRPREVVPETNNQNVQFEQKYKDEAGIKEQNSEMVLIKIGISEKRPSSNGRKREKQGNVGTSIIVGVNSKGEGSTATAAVLCDVKEEEPDSEIDKKADEFIAKFKEQIRLQKVSARAESSRRQLPQRNSLYQT